MKQFLTRLYLEAIDNGKQQQQQQQQQQQHTVGTEHPRANLNKSERPLYDAEIRLETIFLGISYNQ